MFNVYILEKEDELPEEDNCYLITKDKIFFKKRIGMMSGLIPASGGIPFLAKLEPDINMDCPKIPVSIFGKVLSFLKDVYDIHKAEGAVILLYNEETKKYMIDVPTQVVTGASVNYTIEGCPSGYVKVGTIHSHPSFSAFHSGTDTGDEKNFDGIHFTVGHLDDMKNGKLQIVGSIVLNGYRKKINPKNYIIGLEEIPAEVKQYTNAQGEVSTYTTYRDSDVFKLNVPLLNYKRKEWLKKVSKPQVTVVKTFSGNGVYYSQSGDRPLTQQQMSQLKDFADLDEMWGYGSNYGYHNWRSWRSASERLLKDEKEKKETKQEDPEDLFVVDDPRILNLDNIAEHFKQISDAKCKLDKALAEKIPGEENPDEEPECVCDYCPYNPDLFDALLEEEYEIVENHARS